MRVGVCQTPDILGDVHAAVRVIIDLAGQSDADLLVLPECFLQGYLATDEHVRTHAMELESPSFDAVLGRLSGIRSMIVLGMIERSGDDFFNTAVVIDGGVAKGRYRKMFLTAGESVFASGDGYPLFECEGVPFGINICYDAQFAEAAAGVAAGGARLLVLPAQNMMPQRKALHWRSLHNEIRFSRARETGMWLASADVTGTRGDRLGLGPTCVLNPAGEVITQVPLGRVGLVTADIT